MIGRLSYVENWHGQGEHDVFEWRFEDDNDENTGLEPEEIEALKVSQAA